tara:strand:+ start:213 stop:2873 length:2661 start_codon:yes stop_codon:yes gene_type:complete
MLSSAAPGSVPSLAELCAAHVASRLPCSGLEALPARVLARVLWHAVRSGSLEDEHLPLFALSELDLRGSKVTERGLDLVAKTCGSRLLSLDLSQCVRLLSDAGVVALLGGCPRLTRLDLSHCRFTDVTIEAAAQNCPALTSLDYSWNGSGVGDRSARAVAAHCRKLTHLALCGSRVTDGALLSLACACTSLVTLEVRGCHLLSEAGFVAVASQLPRQTRLHLAQWRHVSDASVDLLARKCLRLTELDVSMCDRVGDEAVARAASGFPQLRTLSCYGVGRLQTPRLASSSLELLCLSGSRALAAPVLACPTLHTLQMQNCKDLDAAALAALATSCPKLTSLDLSGCLRLPKLHLTCPLLTELVLDGCVKLVEVEVACPVLRTLRMRGCEACPEAALPALAEGCPALTELDLTSCYQLRRPAIAHAQLRRLALCGIPELQQATVSCASLLELKLQQFAEPSALLGLCGELPTGLQALHLTSQERLDEDTAAALRPLCAGLRQLSLAGCLLPTASLLTLASAMPTCSHLHTLDVSRCSEVTDEVLGRMVPCCPRLRLLDCSELKLARATVVSATLCVLRFNGCGELTEFDVRCPMLHKIELHEAERLQAPRVSSDALRTLSLANFEQLTAPELFCASLTDLDATGCVNLPADAVQSLLPRCPRIRTLDLSGCRRIEALQLVSDSLEVLRVCWCSHLTALSLECPSLRRLYSYGAPRLSQISASCGALRLLELQKAKALEDAALPPLTSSLPALAVLNLTDCQLLRSPTIASDRLTTIHLYNCLQLAAPTIMCPLLTTLNLTYCTALKELTLECPQLASLLCAGCKALREDAVLEAVQACPALRTFDLTGCALVGEGVLTRVEAHCRRELPEEAPAKKARANGDLHRSSA